MRDIIFRRFVGGLLLLVGLYRLAIALEYLFRVVVDGGWTPQSLGIFTQAEFDRVPFALLAIFAGVAILRKRARGTAAVACFVGAILQSLAIYSEWFEAHKWNDHVDLGLYEFEAVYAAIFVLGLVFCFLPQRRSILAASVKSTDAPDDANWRDWLVASLRDTGVEAPPDRFAKAGAAFFGYVLIVGFALIVGNFVVPEIPALAIIWVIVSIAILARLRNLFLRRMWQARSRSAEEELLRAGSRRPVLYLRSFALDATLAAPTLLERFLGLVPLANAEQTLTKLLKRCGPVIAIGRPGEALPALGAARFYVSNERWKDKVSDIVRVAELVVWASGTTEGLHWEISHLVQSLPPEKLVLWVHAPLLRVPETEREAEWTRFREGLGKVFPKPLPERLGHTKFFHFSSTWEPIPVEKPDTSCSQKGALRSLLSRKGYPKPNPEAHALTRRRLAIAFAGCVATCLVLGTGGVLASRLHEQKEQARRDNDSWNELAYQFGSRERDRTADDKPEKFLASLRTVPAEVSSRLSPAAATEVTRVADDYITIFADAHDHPNVEPILFNPHYSLIVNLATAKDAHVRHESVSAVQSALTKFQQDWAHVHSILDQTASTYSMGDFEKRTTARGRVLETEAAAIQFLIDHPDDWSPHEFSPGVRIPLYQTLSTENAFLVLIDARGKAIKAFEAAFTR